jgi:hypothetical protein
LFGWKFAENRAENTPRAEVGPLTAEIERRHPAGDPFPSPEKNPVAAGLFRSPA